MAKALLIILAIIAALALLGVLLGVLFLLLQVGVLMLPACTWTATLMVGAYLLYTRRRIRQLTRTGMSLGSVTTAQFDSGSLKWVWRLEEPRLLSLLDAGMGRVLIALTGLGTAGVGFTRLLAQGEFTEPCWWFWGRIVTLPKSVSIVLGLGLLGGVVLLLLGRLRPECAFRKLITQHAPSLVSPTEVLRLSEVNALYAAALQLLAQVSPAVQAAGELALTQELEALHVGLTADNLTTLVDRREWVTLQQVLTGLLQDVERLRVRVSQAGASTYGGYGYGESEEEKAYRVLGLSATATEEEIKVAFRAEALRSHPDRTNGQSTARMQDVNAAYACLKQHRGFS